MPAVEAEEYSNSIISNDALERAVNALEGIALEKVELTPNFRARIRWEKLPPGFEIQFPKPVIVKHHDIHVLNATVGKILSESGIHDVALSLLDGERGEERFRTLPLDIPKQESVTLKLEGVFFPYASNLDQKIMCPGLDSLRGAIILNNVKIFSRVDDGLRASVEATITNRTCIDIQEVTLLSVDILYKSIKIGYHKQHTFKLLHGPNTDVFSWTFTPPHAPDGDGDFREFISKFLTTEEDIPISLDLKMIQIKVGNRLVVFNGIKVDTTIKGIRQPLIPRVNVYLGPNALLREVAFRFRLVNPIHAPIKIIDSVVDAKFNSHLLSHIEHRFEDLVVLEPEGEKESELVTANLTQGLWRTIWLVRGRTNIKLEVNIGKTTMSIDGHRIDDLEFRLKDVECRIHFGQPAGLTENH